MDSTRLDRGRPCRALRGDGDGQQLRRGTFLRHRLAVGLKPCDVDLDGFDCPLAAFIEGRALGKAAGQGGHRHHEAAGVLRFNHDRVGAHDPLIVSQHGQEFLDRQSRLMEDRHEQFRTDRLAGVQRDGNSPPAIRMLELRVGSPLDDHHPATPAEGTDDVAAGDARCSGHVQRTVPVAAVVVRGHLQAWSTRAETTVCAPSPRRCTLNSAKRSDVGERTMTVSGGIAPRARELLEGQTRRGGSASGEAVPAPGLTVRHPRQRTLLRGAGRAGVGARVHRHRADYLALDPQSDPAGDHHRVPPQEGRQRPSCLRPAVLSHDSAEPIQAILTLYDTVVSLETDKQVIQPLDMAFLKYGGTFSAKRWGENVVDLTTALEASRSGTDKTDISLRVCTRAAALLATDDDNPSVIFGDLKILYDLRSNLVHGSAISRNTLDGWLTKLSIFREGDMPNMRIQRAVDRLRDLVRRAIVARLLLAADGRWPLVGKLPPIDRIFADWEKSRQWRAAWHAGLSGMNAPAAIGPPAPLASSISDEYPGKDD